MRRPRGPQIGLKLILAGLPLLIIPFLGGRYVGQTKSFILEGQQEALRVASQAVATVLHGREDLFSAGLPSVDRRPENLYAAPLPGPIRLDGEKSEWVEIADHMRHFGGDPLVPVAGETSDPRTLSVDLILGQRGSHLYAWIEVYDDKVLHRDPGYRRLDHSDHLRLTIPGHDDAEPQRFVILAPASGPVTAYSVDDEFLHALAEGAPDPRIRGHWRDTESGYAIELRLEQSLFGEITQLRLELADVDDEFYRNTHDLVGTLPADYSGRFNPVLLLAPGLDRVLRELDLEGATIEVVDNNEQVLEVSGPDVSTREDPANAARKNAIVKRALAGQPAASQPSGAAGEPATIFAAWPIFNGDDVLGAVLIGRRVDQILAPQQRVLEQFVNELLVVVFVVAAWLLLFAWRLTHRIRRLGREAAGAIDPNGRVRVRELDADARSGDELGDLSRTVTGLLRRVARYMSFLESLPRTLRHELSNPFNTVSTSLQNLEEAHPELAESRYLLSAKRGLARLTEILTSMTEAASLDEALGADERGRFDLAQLVRRYVENIDQNRDDRSIRPTLPEGEIWIEGSDFRIEQLLDKLIDNALDFGEKDAPIEVALSASAGEAMLEVTNTGPPLPEGDPMDLFDPLVTGRGPNASPQSHSGLGLYIVRAIAERHGGAVTARDRPDGSGVELRVRLPLAAPAQV